MAVVWPFVALKTVFAPFCMLREEILVILRLSGLLEAESRRGFPFWPIIVPEKLTRILIPGFLRCDLRLSHFLTVTSE